MAKQITLTLEDEQIARLIDIVGSTLSTFAGCEDDYSPAQVRALLPLYDALTDGKSDECTSEKTYRGWQKEAEREVQQKAS